MVQRINFIIKLLTITNFVLTAANATCFKTYKELNAVEERRGNNNTIPITRIICSNSIFLIGEFDPWLLNGNTNYLCGTSGSSANKCVVRGGEFQVDIGDFYFNRSKKANILLSGFTFESAIISSTAFGSAGKITIRDCIFKDHHNHGVFQANNYGGPPLLDSSNRMLSKSYLMSRMNQFRQLLIGGGSESRSTIHFDRCKFLNNSLTSDIIYPTLASNGPVDVLSHFADVTMSNCLLKDNRYEFSLPAVQEAYLIRVRASATLNISDSCFINNYVAGVAPVNIVADSGLVATNRNYVTETPLDDVFNEPVSSCQYMVLTEAYKCVAPESSICNLPDCKASYQYYNANTDKFVANIINGGTINASPCGFNIKTNLPCATTGKNVTLQLLYPNNTIVTSQVRSDPFFLYGQSSRGNILSGSVARGTYKIQALVNGVVQPSPATFTISGKC